MNLEGFARSLQGDFVGVVGVLFFIGILYFLVRFVIKRGSVELNEELPDAGLKMVNIVASVIVGLVLVAFFGRAVSMGFSNRLPRSVDKSSVYEQMDSHRVAPEPEKSPQ